MKQDDVLVDSELAEWNRQLVAAVWAPKCCRPQEFRGTAVGWSLLSSGASSL